MSRFGAGKAADSSGDSASDDKPEPAPARGRGKADGSLADGFAKTFADIPESTVLILVEGEARPRTTRCSRRPCGTANPKSICPPKGVALERWIGNRGTEAGVKVTQGAQATLAAALADQQALANELDKLALYVGPGGTVDERVLRDMSYASRQEDVFELTNAVARRDTKGALLQLQRLLDGGTAAEGILPALAWQVRTLIQIRDMIDRRVPDQHMADKAGLNDFVVRKSVGQARQFTMKKLLQIHERLLQLDHAVKTGRADADLSIDALVVEICQP